MGAGCIWRDKRVWIGSGSASSLEGTGGADSSVLALSWLLRSMPLISSEIVDMSRLREVNSCSDASLLARARQNRGSGKNGKFNENTQRVNSS